MRAKIAAGVVAAGALFLAATQQAQAWTAVDTSASPPGGLPCATDSQGTKACYQSSADVLWIKDSRNDSARAEAVVSWYGGAPIDICHDYLGPSAGWTRCVTRIRPKGRQIFFWTKTVSNSGGVIGTPSPIVITRS